MPDGVDDWLHLPPAKRIDELGDFLEWLANAKPEDEETIRREINRYWGSAGDFHALGTLNFLLSQVLKPGTTRQDRQQILELIDNYSRHDPAEVAQFYDQLFDSILLLFPGMPRSASEPKQKPALLTPGAVTSAAEQAAADTAAWDTMNWDERGRYMEDRAGRTLPSNRQNTRRNCHQHKIHGFPGGYVSKSGYVGLQAEKIRR